MIDFVLVLDGSGSVDTSADLIKAFAQQTIDKLELSTSAAQVAIVSFNLDATVLSPLSADRSALAASISLYQPGGLTNITAGMVAGQAQLVGASARAVARKIMFVVSDGIQSSVAGGDKAAIESAAEVRLAGTTLFAIGFGSGVEVQTLDMMASTPTSDHSFLGSSVNDISNRFADLCTALNSPPSVPPPPLPRVPPPLPPVLPPISGSSPMPPCSPPPLLATRCDNSCQFSNDQECDDGGPASSYTACIYGTDCADCGERGLEAPPPQPATPPLPPSVPADCANSCRFPSDLECDDGGAGSEYSECDIGTVKSWGLESARISPCS